MNVEIGSKFISGKSVVTQLLIGTERRSRELTNQFQHFKFAIVVEDNANLENLIWYGTQKNTNIINMNSRVYVNRKDWYHIIKNYK